MHPVGLPQTTWALKFCLFSEYDKKLLGVFSFPFPTFQFPKRILLNFWVLYIFFTSANPLPALVHHHGCLNYAVCVLSKPQTLCTFDLTSFIWDLKCFNDTCCCCSFYLLLSLQIISPPPFSWFDIQMELSPKANLSSCLTFSDESELFPMKTHWIKHVTAFLLTCGFKELWMTSNLAVSQFCLYIKLMNG